MEVAGLTEFGRLTRVLLKHPREAFRDEQTIAAQWKALGFTDPPDLGRALAEYERFEALIRTAGAEVEWLPSHSASTLDSIYVRDASVPVPGGVVLARMGKAARDGEPDAQRQTLEALGVPIVGRIEPPGFLEGGDLVWLDPHTLVIGRGYRTNAAGIGQLRAFFGRDVDVVVVPLPHWEGESEVMHLMSLISPVDKDLAVVYSPLLPIPFRKWLLGRGMQLVEVPHGEFASMGSNVLAASPRRCIMLAGNPRVRAALEQAGAEVLEYDGVEISRKGGGGPTCLTRPLARAPAD